MSVRFKFSSSREPKEWWLDFSQETPKRKTPPLDFRKFFKMEIKRKTEITVETRKRFVVRLPETAEAVFCPHCKGDEPMLTAEQAAVFLRIGRRTIYRWIETGAAHFIESESSAVLVCLASLDTILSDAPKQLP